MIAFLFMLWSLAADPDPSLSYTVSIQDPSTRTVDIRLEISGLSLDMDPLPLMMTKAFAFVRLEEPLMEGEVHAEDASVSSLSVTRQGPYRWKVETRGARRIIVRYRIPLQHRNLPEVKEARDAYEFPYLDDDHGMLSAGALFIAPEMEDLPPTRIAFALPQGWEVLCPWKKEGREFAPARMDELLDDLIAIGHWSKHPIRVGGMEITVAFAPRQKKLEELAGPLIERIVRAELALFERVPKPKYLFLFGRPDIRGFGGSPKTGCMTLCVDPGAKEPVLVEALGHLVAHEFHHLWNASRYRCPDALRFFNEGFTDYYAHLILAREGIIEKARFLDVLCENMSQCETNGKRGKLSLAEAGGDIFFSDREAYDLVYHGGLLVAALLDAHLRKAQIEGGLDRFMRAFNNDPRWSLGEKGPELGDFVLCIESFLGSDSADHFLEFVKAPFSLAPVEAFAAAGIVLNRSEEKAPLRLRGNLDKEAGTLLIDLDPGGVAYRLGVRPGDRFVMINGVKPKTREEVYRAWSQPQGNRMRITLVRDEKILEIDLPVPDRVAYKFIKDAGLFGLSP